MWNRYWRESLRLGMNWKGCQACPPEKRDPEAVLQVNHVISKQRLKRFCKEHGQGPGYLLLLLTDPRNSMLVDERCHEGHTTGMRPIPREAIPSYAWEFEGEYLEVDPPKRLVQTMHNGWNGLTTTETIELEELV